MKENIHVSQYNFHPEVVSGFRLPASIIVNDVTLREGEQGSEVKFSAQEKVEFALMLDAAGVPQIEIGWAGTSAADREVIKRLKASGLRARLQALVLTYDDTWPEQCDRCLECGVDVIALLHAASAMRLRDLNTTPEAVLEKTSRAVDYVVSRGGTAAFVPTDSTRTDLSYLKEISANAVRAGASRIVLPDTVGAAMPGAMRYIVGEMVKTVPVPIHVHCHNDFGVGLANTLAAVEAGASMVDASVNGLGERGGNTALDELVMALEIMYGFDTGIDLSQMFKLSRHAERLSGVPLPLNKPLVGENAFAHKLDVHLRGVMNDPALFETIPPEMVGNRRKLCLGGHAGPLVIRTKLEEMGLSADETQVAEITARVRASALEKRAGLDDNEFLGVYRQVVGGD